MYCGSATTAATPPAKADGQAMIVIKSARGFAASPFTAGVWPTDDGFDDVTGAGGSGTATRVMIIRTAKAPASTIKKT